MRAGRARGYVIGIIRIIRIIGIIRIHLCVRAELEDIRERAKRHQGGVEVRRETGATLGAAELVAEQSRLPRGRGIRAPRGQEVRAPRGRTCTDACVRSRNCSLVQVVVVVLVVVILYVARYVLVVVVRAIRSSARGARSRASQWAFRPLVRLTTTLSACRRI